MPETTPESWIAPESPDLVWFGGADAERFLNDLISQEIGDMQPGESRRSLLLGPQGKLDHILWVVKDEARFGLVTDPGRGEELASTLGRYRIRVDVEIEPEHSPVWLVIGEGDGFDISWTGAPRHLIIGERPDLPVGSSTDYESLRVAAGEPLMGIDVEQSTIPEEAGLVDVSVDFTKGCYLGQELVARINSRGRNVPRRLRLLDLAAPTAASAPIVLGDKEVGTLTSANGVSGMALIHRDAEPGDTVSVGGVEAVVREIPPKPKT
jgi:folate-binding protein YgfZ